jgi:hypothetical protein
MKGPMAKDVSFRRLVIIFSSALLGTIVFAILLRFLFPQGGPLTLAVPIAIFIAITLPLLTGYFKKKV